RGVAHTSRLTTAAGRYTARPARPVPTRVPRAARAGGGGMAAAAAGASAWDDTTWAAWGVGLVEPLLDPHDRVATLEAMSAQASQHRLRAVTLLAGTLTDLLDSLPDDDPWRHADPAVFGTYRDGLDLVPTEAT